jgi:kinesin family protein 6/9
MGKMTLTKLKDAFAIFKNLVRDARGSGSSSSGLGGEGLGGGRSGSSSSGSSGGGAGDAAALLAEAAALRQALKEREAEIAILVNMVKQANSGSSGAKSDGGSSGADAKGSSSSSGSSMSGGGSSTGPPSVGEAKASSSSSSSSSHKALAPLLRAPPPPSKVCGVALSADPALLSDAEQAFEHFRRSWPRGSAIEANKKALKEKYDLAKELYEKV